jgi:hypothetical protein
MPANNNTCCLHSYRIFHAVTKTSFGATKRFRVEEELWSITYKCHLRPPLMSTLEYRIHLLNITLPRDVVLSPTVSLRTLSEEEICKNYPFNEARHGRPYFNRTDWLNHKVEAVI